MGAAAVKIPAADREVTAKDNAPPDPFGTIKAHIDDLLIEARNFADGKAIGSQAEADRVDRLVDDLRKAEKAAEEARAEEAKPFDDGKAAVQAKYNPLIAPLKNKEPGSVPKAVSALLNSLTAWRVRVAAEEKAKADALAKEAAEKAAAAVAAVQAAAQSSDLAAMDDAEDVFKDARRATQEAARAEKSAGVGLGLRTVWTATLTDQTAAVRHYWTRNPEPFRELVQRLADADVRASIRSIPGFTITSEQKAF
jgi:hypothetical protein